MRNHTWDDKDIGEVAGAIYTDVAAEWKHPTPPVFLVPPITYKVRKILYDSENLEKLEEKEIKEIACHIRVSLVPLLFSYEMESKDIDRISHTIERATEEILKKKNVKRR